jgi:hypothetical protein
MHAPTALLICLEPPRSYFKCHHADPSMAKPEEGFRYKEQEYVISVGFVCIYNITLILLLYRNMPRIARCTGIDPHRLFYIDWVPDLLQLCLGGICCGVPFGNVRQLHPYLQLQSVMSSFKAHVDWEKYRLPAPYGDDMAGAETCLMVLSLFAAFPELTSIPAFNRGGQGWTGRKHALSEIGVGKTATTVWAVYTA